jgi:hypothetical protein
MRKSARTRNWLSAAAIFTGAVSSPALADTLLYNGVAVDASWYQVDTTTCSNGIAYSGFLFAAASARPSGGNPTPFLSFQENTLNFCTGASAVNFNYNVTTPFHLQWMAV